MIENYSRVEVISAAYSAEGVPQGARGYVIEVLGEEMYEIEFSDPRTGVNYAQLVLPGSVLRVVPEEGG